MTEKIYIGIDNGTSGSIGVAGYGISKFILTPIKKEQSYTRAKNVISRVDVVTLKNWIEAIINTYSQPKESILVVMERPMINPSMFKTSMSASRCLEAELCVIEEIGLPLMYIDSKAWQKDILPKGTVGTAELKKASMDIGCRLYPEHRQQIIKHKDADGLLIAHWARKCGF